MVTNRLFAFACSATLPSTPISVVYRADSSGTNAVFTGYLAAESKKWTLGSGKTVQWPTGVGGQGNDGVSAAIQQNTGGLGYVELSYAIDNKLTMAMVKNKDDMVAVQPALRGFRPAAMYKKFSTPYHPGALKYFADNNIQMKTTP